MTRWLAFGQPPNSYTTSWDSTLRGLQQQYQMEYFGLDMAFGGLPHEKVMRAMKLFAEEVMPKFQ